jgi:hypothetical protein
MSNSKRRAVRRLHQEQKQKLLDQFLALCMQLRVLTELNPQHCEGLEKIHEALHSQGLPAVRIACEGLAQIVHGVDFHPPQITEFFLGSYLRDCGYTKNIPPIFSYYDDYAKTETKTASHPVRAPRQIPGQAARFKNYRR